MNVDVETTKYMVSSVPSMEAKQKIVDEALKNGKITDAFIKEFHDMLNFNNIAASKNLDADFISNHPDLFDIDTYINYLKTTKAENIEIDISMYESYMEKIKEAFPNDYEKIIIKSIRNATKEQLEDINIVNSVYDISPEVDKVLFIRIKNNKKLLDSLIALQLVEHNVSSVMFTLLSDEYKEGYLGDKMSVKDFFDAIFNANSDSWRTKMLNKLNNNEITLIPTSEDLSETLFSYIKLTNELDNIVSLLNNEKYYPHSINPSLLKWCLIYKEFNEDQLIQIVNVLKQNGLYFEVKKIAQSSDFTKLLEILD